MIDFNLLKSNLLKQKVLPILNTSNLSQDIEIVEKLISLNINTIEITLRNTDSFDIANSIKSKFSNISFGLGSITTLKIFKTKHINNFDFFVSPGINYEIISYLHRKNYNYIPGAETTSEIMYLLQNNYTIIKFFHAEMSGGIDKLKAIKNIFKNAFFIPTGGINKNNYEKYLKLKNVLCVGSSQFLEIFD